MNFKLPSSDSATTRGLRTIVQAFIGFIIGLGVAIWAVPGVPAAVTSYVQGNLPQLLLMVGVPVAISSGLISFIWNFFRKGVKNY